MDSIRQQIIDAIDSRLKTITMQNGYNSDIGNNVFYWRAENYGKEELPLMEYRDIACATRRKGLLEENTITVEVEVATAAGTTTAREIKSMIADTRKAIQIDTTWGKLAANTRCTGDEIAIEQKEKIIGGAKITFEIDFRTPVGDPYTAK